MATFMDVVDELIDRGQNGITSLSELARRMAEIESRQTPESWRRTLRKHRGEAQPTEETITVAARAFAVDRAEFPPGSPRRRPVERLEGRVATIEDRLAQIEKLLDA